MSNYYDILGLSRNARDADIRAAYRKLASAYHPDKYPENTKFAEDMMKQINAAYSVLSDSSKKSQYDSWLNSQTSGSSSGNYSDRSGGGTNESKSSSSNYAEKNSYSARSGAKKTFDNIFSTEFYFFKKNKAVVLGIIGFFLFAWILSLIPKNENAAKIEAPVVAYPYKLSDDGSPVNGWTLKIDQPGFKLNLYKNNSMGYWRLVVNGKEDPSVNFASISKIISVTSNSGIAGYLLETHCGGNGCGPAYFYIDLENKTVTQLPIDQATFGVDVNGIYAEGSQGLNKLGDPIPIRLNYRVVDWQNSKNYPYWIDSKINPQYAKIIGKHPEDFFADADLRSQMVFKYGEDLFRAVREKTKVAGPTGLSNGHLLILEGCMPHACNTNSAITVINLRTNDITTLFMEDGYYSTAGDKIIDENKNVDGMNISAYSDIFSDYVNKNDSSKGAVVNASGGINIINR
jgi:curved DNA-binding protein CbpA